jgi:translation initiation factor IF-3
VIPLISTRLRQAQPDGGCLEQAKRAERHSLKFKQLVNSLKRITRVQKIIINNTVIRTKRRFSKNRIVVKKFRVNNYIRVPEVMVIDEEGNNIGEKTTAEALQLAESKGLDLIEVSPLAKPPVCRIMDYGKFQYEQSRNQQKAKIKTKKTETKGIRLTFKIGQHDMAIRQKQTDKFLSQGHKVKIELRLRGREKAFRDKAREVIQGFLDGIETEHKVEAPIKQQGGTLTTIINK